MFINNIMSSIVLLSSDNKTINLNNLDKKANVIIQELNSLGYNMAKNNKVINIKISDKILFNNKAGGWNPAFITIKETLNSEFNHETLLRHELMHEAIFRTCKNNLSLWENEIIAIHFSKEYMYINSENFEQELQELQHIIDNNIVLNSNAKKAIAHLLKKYSWNVSKCKIPTEFYRNLKKKNDISYRLIHLYTNRVYDYTGEQNIKTTVGSLLKIPVATSMQHINDKIISKALLKSDSNFFQKHKKYINLQKLSFILNKNIHEFDKNLLGFQENTDIYKYSLTEITEILRHSFLSMPKKRFESLNKQSISRDSTLFKVNSKTKQLLSSWNAFIKTGTNKNYLSFNDYGHLVVLWPSKNPEFLAVIRKPFSSGKQLAEESYNYLYKWSSKNYNTKYHVKIKLLSRYSNIHLQKQPLCKEFLIHHSWFGKNYYTSTCGFFKFNSNLYKAKKERYVNGIINNNQYLITDAESYADAVENAEGDIFNQETKLILRGIIIWNGVFSNFHRDHDYICDTTQCMVYLGLKTLKLSKVNFYLQNTSLWNIIKQIANNQNKKWLYFSLGGKKTWVKHINSTILHNQLKENFIKNITKTIDNKIHLLYLDSEEFLECEIFRNKLKLLSCPNKIKFDKNNNTWIFEGIGTGHNLGFNLLDIDAKAQKGLKAHAILNTFYK